MPAYLTEEAAAEWIRLEPKLVALGLMSQLDRAAFAFYCQAYGRYVYAEKQIELARKADEAERREGGGVYYMAGKDRDTQKLTAWVQISRIAFEQTKSLLSEFGLSPAARARMGTDPAQLNAANNARKKKSSGDFEF
jgi:P27 family predicted phage terminase small subunit